MPKIGDVIGFVNWHGYGKIKEGRVISANGDFYLVKNDEGYHNFYPSRGSWWYIEKREKVRWREEGF